MLHYVNGKEVVGNAATNSNVIHAHQICIEWCTSLSIFLLLIVILKAADEAVLGISKMIWVDVHCDEI